MNDDMASCLESIQAATSSFYLLYLFVILSFVRIEQFSLTIFLTA